jgi:hypothetical protein
MAKTLVTDAVLVDTGILYALADRKDRWHFSSIQPKHCRNFELLP